MMAWARWLVRAVVGCPHRDADGSLMYFERRRVEGRGEVLHLVCLSCGKAVPALDSALPGTVRRDTKVSKAQIPMNGKSEVAEFPRRRRR